MKELLVQPKTQIFHPNPQVFKLTAWLLSLDSLKQKVFLDGLEIYSPHHGDLAKGKITLANLGDTIAGVVKGKNIPIHSLW
jgi:predicted XRE-type DNA-binding protein